MAAVSVAPQAHPPVFAVIGVCRQPTTPTPPSLFAFKECGSPVAFWEMQSFVNDSCKGEGEGGSTGERVIKCHTSVTTSNANTHFFVFSFPSPPSLFFPPPPPHPDGLSCSVSLSFYLSVAHQGPEEGRSDDCRTSEEDREQPQSPRLAHQGRPGTCLKHETNEKTPLERPVCQSALEPTVRPYPHCKWKEMEKC